MIEVEVDTSPQPVQQQGLRQGQDPVCQNTPVDTCSTDPQGRRYQRGEERQELIDKGAQQKRKGSGREMTIPRETRCKRPKGERGKGANRGHGIGMRAKQWINQ